MDSPMYVVASHDYNQCYADGHAPIKAYVGKISIIPSVTFVVCDENGNNVDEKNILDANWVELLDHEIERYFGGPSEEFTKHLFAETSKLDSTKPFNSRVEYLEFVNRMWEVAHTYD